ncbi:MULTISPECIES: helix-turn-helix domain-containing protein [unclassified Paenibacillus]|uniref:helix-turn-helix domain-containing protein n=1 Tax=unclassified Paenibacillus TaxID=185978 RepID=UPI0036317C21
MQHFSYLTRLIMFGCLLCTLPAICFGIFSYIQSSNEIQKQVNSRQIQVLTLMNSNVEQVLRTVNHAFDQLVNSTVVARALNETFSPDDFLLYRNLRKEISNTQSYFTKVEDIVIVNIEQNWMIKNSGYYKFNTYLHHTQIANQMLLPNTISWSLNPSIWFYSEEKANAYECPYVISLVKKLPDQKLDKFGLAFANLPTCSIGSILNYTPAESETVIIMDDQERILFHTDPSMIGKYAISTGFISDSHVFSQPVGQFETELGGKKYSATYLRSSLNNWIYLSIISIDSLTQDSKKIGRYLIFFCLIIIAVFLVIAWLGSRQMYNPIQSLLKQIGGSPPSSVKPGMNEFEIISNQVQNLFQSKSQLEQEASRHLQQSSTFFLMNMFQKDIRRNELTEKMELFGFSEKLAQWQVMSVIALQIDTLEGTRYSKDDLELLLFAINNIVEEIIPSEVRLPPVSIEHTQITLIGGVNSEAQPEYNGFIYSTTESIQSAIKRVLDLQVSIGISLPFHDIKKASAAYHEGLEALKHRIYLGEHVIIPYANINAGKQKLLAEYPSLAETELFDAILIADEEKSRELLKAFMQLIFKQEMNPQEYQVSIFRFLNSLMVSMQQSGISLNQLHSGGGSLYEELNALQITHEIEEWFWSRVITPLIRIFRDRQNSQYHNISEKIMDMIHKYYDTDLTIEKCATEMHYNANYLSGVFRKETSVTFSEYLSSYRLNMAKKWLMETDITIKEISEKLQYINSQNFIRSFRKQEGVTPGQFRESHRK